MREIALTLGQVALVDDADYDLVAGRRWHAERGKWTYYAVTREMRRGVKRNIHMHRVISGAPDGIRVDHANGCGTDNRRTNLRWATNSQNGANQRLTVRNRSGRKGVSRSSSGWQVSIRKLGKSIYLGTFDDLDEAARAYDAAARSLFGDFARLNFPEVPL